MRQLRTFSHAPRPKPGQSFTSYMETLAAEHVPPLDLLTLLHACGVIEDDVRSALPAGYGIDLTDHQVANVAFTLRLEERIVRDMLLRRFDGIALDLSMVQPDETESYRLGALNNWGFFTTTRLCPCCMRESAYFRLAHRLPWLFACTDHQVLLSDHCPRCTRPHGNVVQSYGGKPAYPTIVPDPSRCRNPPMIGGADFGCKAQPCGANLITLPATDLAPYPRVIAAQTRLEENLSGGMVFCLGQQLPPLEYFGMLRSLLSLLSYGADVEDLGSGLPDVALEAARHHSEERHDVLKYGKVTQKRGGTPYRSSAWMSAFAPTAVELLDLPDEDALSQALQPHMAQAARFKASRFRGLLGRNYFNFQGPLLRATEAVLAPRSNAVRRVGHASSYSHHPDRPYAYSSDHVPQLLWSDAFEAFQPFFEGSDMGEPYVRSFISMNLIKLCGDFTWVQTAHELGLLPSRASGIANKALTVMRELGTYEAYLTTLHQTAAALEQTEDRFNFGDCRRTFINLNTIPFSDWRLELAARDLNPGKQGGKHRWASTYVWALLTAGHPSRAPALQGLSTAERIRQGQLFGRFTRFHLAELTSVIHDTALSLNRWEPLAGEQRLKKSKP